MRTLATNIRSVETLKTRIYSGKINMNKNDRALFNELLLLLNFYIDTDKRTTERMLETMVAWSLRQLFALQAHDDTEINEFFLKNFIVRKVDDIIGLGPEYHIEKLSNEISMKRFTQSHKIEDLQLDLTKTMEVLVKDIINFKTSEYDYKIAGSRG